MENLSLKEKQIVYLETQIAELQNELSQLTYHPENQGILIFKYVKCGKQGCRCQNGFPHGPYIYRQYYEDGKKKQKYVSKKQAEKIAAEVEENQRYKRLKAEIKQYENKLKEARA